MLHQMGENLHRIYALALIQSHVPYWYFTPQTIYVTVAPQDQNGTGKPYCLVMSQLLWCHSMVCDSFLVMPRYITPTELLDEVKQSTLNSVQHGILDHDNKRQCDCLYTNHTFYHYSCEHFYLHIWKSLKQLAMLCYCLRNLVLHHLFVESRRHGQWLA